MERIVSLALSLLAVDNLKGTHVVGNSNVIKDLDKNALHGG